MRFVGGYMNKQAVYALLAVLMISILPGCGKSKNSSGPVGGGGPVYVPPVQPTIPVPPQPTGGCYDTRSIQGSGVTLGFGGTVYGATGITANMSLYGTASLPGGYTNTYWRTTRYGDRVDIAISGSSAYAQITASVTAVAYVNQWGGGAICGFYVNASTLNPAVNGYAWSGNIGGGKIELISANGLRVQL
jgi:hypothetical protein